MPTRSTRTYSLGDEAVISGPVARGEVGQVWKLTTDAGVFAVKEPFERPDVVEVEDDAAFQDLVAAAGLSMPPVIRTVENGQRARRYRLGMRSGVRLICWDLTAPSIRWPSVPPWRRCTASATAAPTDCIRGTPSPVGAERWDELVDTLRAGGAPFAERLAEQHDELVALERLDPSPVERASVSIATCSNDVLSKHPAGEVCIIELGEQRLADPGEELAVVLFELRCGSS